MSMTSSEEPKPADSGTQAGSDAPVDQGPGEAVANAAGATPASTKADDSAAAVIRDSDFKRDDNGSRDSSGGGLGILQLVGSALAAALGVQSSKNRERDFKEGRAGTFILVGIVFTALFIGAVYGVVSLVLSSR